MVGEKLSSLQKQVGRVSRRLFWQRLLNSLVWCWAGALVLSAGWFVLEPLVLAEPVWWLRWAVAGAALGVATVLAGAVALCRAPSRLAAALLLDERFGLKERVTTSLTLPTEQAHTPAGMALLDDANQRAAGLDVRSAFPVRMGWTALVVPALAVLLAAVAIFYEPPRTPANNDTPEQLLKVSAKEKQDIEKKLAALVKKKNTEPKPQDKPKSEELQRIEAELEKIAARPRDTRDQLRDRLKEATALEDQMKKRQQDLLDKNRSLRNQLQQMDKLSGNDAKEGPAKDLQKALSEGNLDKAREEMDRLAKKIQNNELTDKEREQLQRQIKDIQDKLQRLSRQQEKEDQLRQLEREGKLDAEQLQRELDKLQQERDRLKDLEDIAKKLEECGH